MRMETKLHIGVPQAYSQCAGGSCNGNDDCGSNMPCEKTCTEQGITRCGVRCQ